MKIKTHNMAIFIEFVAGSGLAVLFHWVLHYKEAAYMIFGFGILLSLATYLIREEMETTREGLLEQYSQAHETTYAISRITDPECQSKANELISGTMKIFQLLQEGYIPLEETEFYLEGAKQSDQSVRQVNAVDPMTAGWDSRGALLNFYQANLRAMQRGVRVTRTFVVNRDEFEDQNVQMVLLHQLRDGIEVRIAFRDELPVISGISGRDTNNTFDFAIYDDKVVTDVFNQPGRYFGRKTSQPAEVAKYLNFYTLIEHSSHVVALKDDRVLLPTDLVATEN
ncbi:MAG: hypothetical protein VB050_09630 [Geobacteraceae bacterium]|nr:hypothetical protein [Geobacteraceae bacterium]